MSFFRPLANALAQSGKKKDALVVGKRTRPGQVVLGNRDLSVDGAKILVMRLRQVGRVGRQTKWVDGDGGSLANGRFN
jgi:hypothetical protein